MKIFFMHDIWSGNSIHTHLTDSQGAVSMQFAIISRHNVLASYEYVIFTDELISLTNTSAKINHFYWFIARIQSLIEVSQNYSK